MNRCNKPISIVPDIEDYESIHVIGIGKAGAYVLKVSPARGLDDFDPGADLSGSVSVRI
ncbi:MAG TPA: hypothetical protein VL986_05020 [Terracidiphilus sp.]|nr:hypothetical protein [Terracidiphilus sp.]